ncbi:MAG: FGGY-family carbohydrate kinase [Pirellulales bacterium]|nr:FGGY-family carbohydrate kinase [Pirellulales bacterium]
MSNSEQYVLAFDLGSGGPKVALVSTAGEVVAHAKRRVETYLLPAGGAEQDPEEWWQSIVGAAREVLALRLVPVEQIVAICGTAQWAVTVPIDREGRVLHRAVHWLDSRGAPYSRQVTDGWPKISGYGLARLLGWLRYTGGAPTHSGADALAHILYLKHGCPDVWAATDKLLEPVDYINLRLTGRAVASRGTVFPYFLTDNRRNLEIDYAPRLLEWTGIERAKLPDLQPVDAVLGPILPAVAEELGLGRHVQVVAGSCDSQVAILGSGAVADFEPHLCIGTSSWLTCHVPFKKTDLFRYLATMPSAVPGKNMVVAELGASGKCLEAVAERWFLAHHPPGSDEAYAELVRLAESAPPGCDGMIFLPWLNGAGPPTGDAHARGGFFNQSLHAGRGHACRAVLEGVAGNLRWLLDNVETFLGRKIERLHFIGGGARLELWCQILADVLDRPIAQVAEPHLAIVRGAALAAWLALGRLQLEEIPAKVRVEMTFTPRPEHRAAYDQMFRTLVDCFQTNKRLFARLNSRG